MNKIIKIRLAGVIENQSSDENNKKQVDEKLYIHVDIGI